VANGKGKGKAPTKQAPAVPSPFDPGSLEISVFDPAGHAVPAIVSVRIASIEETRQQPTDRNGLAVFPNVPAGDVTVTVDAGPDFGPVPSGGAKFKPGKITDTVKVAPGPEVTHSDAIVTKAVAFLRVQVRKTDHKSPMAKVPVTVNTLPNKTTDEFGMADYGPVPAGVLYHCVAGNADPAVKPHFGPAVPPPQPVILGTASNDRIPSIGEVSTAVIELEERKLEIVKIDDHFASSKEKLEIRYAILGLAGRVVRFTIEGDNYTGKKMVDRDMSADETKDGANNLISWDGKIEVGALKDKFANPLLGPFKVTLFHDDANHTGVLKSDKTFKILYHSVVPSMGKHMADETLPPESDQNKFVQAKLNELGYDAGPVNGTVGTTTTNAIRRFQRANYQAGTQILLTENGTADATLIAAIKAASARQIFESGKDPITQDAKFYIYDNFLCDRGQNFITTGLPQFQSTDRKTHAENKMERAFIPLEVEVRLLTKANNGVSAPDAIGAVPVALEVADTPEDSSVIAGTNPTAKTYVQHAREIGTSATVAGAAKINADGDNALDTFDGMRKAADADYIKQWFPDDSGSKLDPYTVKKYDTESRGGKTFQRAIVEAWADAANHPKRKGRAGAYFRFSTKGGDNAKVRASLAFKDLPNKDQLEKDHAAAKVTLFKELGKWTVWRRSKVNAYCQQAAPSRVSGSPTWSAFRDRYKEAYLEIENNGQPRQNLTYSSVVTQAKYNAAILGLPATHAVPGVTAANLVYRAGSVYGGVFPPRAQSPGERARDYVNSMQAAVGAWCANPLHAILQLIHAEARKTDAEGYVVYDFRLSESFTGQDWNPALNHGHGGFQPTADPKARNFRPSAAGYVHVDGAVTMCVDNPFNIDCYLTHECGHARFLIHHRFVSEAPSPTVSANPTHHDGNQDKCTMSYAAPGDTPDQWRYFFCGKCLLRMRGWQILSLPQKYT
jgi:peptidoglycan hydrolase-like protein with peptidoglycan-binding domain